MPDDDIALSEKRLYGDRRTATRAFVASGLGVAYVDVSDDQVGRFGLDHRCSARDVAGANGRLLVATDEDVLVGSDGGFEPTGFGPAVAVGTGVDAHAAGPDGRVARLRGDAWETVGRVDDVRAIDCSSPTGGSDESRADDRSPVTADDGMALIAAADGVYASRPEDGLVHVGLDEARDVASAVGLAATGDGIFRREGDWRLASPGDATVVAGERGTAHEDAPASESERTHAVVDGNLRSRSAGEWTDAGAPGGTVVDVAYGEGTLAVTGDGRLLLDPRRAKDGSPEWRSRSLGLADVVAIAVP